MKVLTLTAQFPTITLEASKYTSKFIFDQRKDHFRLVSNVQPATGDVIQFSPLLINGEVLIDGLEMERRSQTMKGALAGQLHAEWLIKHQEKISPEMQKYIIIFLGTEWRGQLENRPVPCLICFHSKWHVLFLWLGDTFDANFLLARLSQQS